MTDSIGDRIDATIAESEQEKAQKRAEAERLERKRQEAQQRASELVEAVVLPALREVAESLRERGHDADVSVSGSESSRSVEFSYWPGQRPEGRDYTYQLELTVGDGDFLRVREVTRTSRGSSSTGMWMGEPHSPQATKEDVQAVVLYVVEKALREQT